MSLVNPRRRPRRFASEAERKLWAAVHAKSLLGRANYLSDLVNDELYPNPLHDELTHLAAELLLGRGSFKRRAIRWSKKFMKYRLNQPAQRVGTGSMLGLVTAPKEIRGRKIGLRRLRSPRTLKSKPGARTQT